MKLTVKVFKYCTIQLPVQTKKAAYW